MRSATHKIIRGPSRSPLASSHMYLWMHTRGRETARMQVQCVARYTNAAPRPPTGRAASEDPRYGAMLGAADGAADGDAVGKGGAPHG